MAGRAYAGTEDLRRMQAAVSRTPGVTSLRIGDLAYLARFAPHRDLGGYIRLWEDGDDVVAFAFLQSKGEFNLFVAESGRRVLLDEMLDFVEAAAAELAAAGDPPLELSTWGIDETRSDVDRETARALRERGFQESDESGGVLARGLDDLPGAELPDGYRLAGMDDALIDSRVETQRLVFAPSIFTAETYRRARRTWPYRPDLDRVIVDVGGEVVAFCTAWIDEGNGSGMFEPVGVHPAHRRLGLGRAVCLDALQCLRDLGASRAEVAYNSEAGRRLYESMGFTHAWGEAIFTRRG